MGMVMAPSMNTATAGVLPQDSGVAAALVSTMQQVGGSIGTAVMSTIAASVTTSYASSHAVVKGYDEVAATHGFAVVFLVSSIVFAVGGVLAAALFPSKAKLTAMREAVAAASAPAASAPADKVDLAKSLDSVPADA